MSKVTSDGFAASGLTPATYNLVRPNLNFPAQFRVKQSKPGEEVILTNTTSPIDRPEKIRIAYSEIANVYAGTGIEASISAPSKKGVSILAQETSVLSVSDTTDADYRIDLPISCHLVIKVPTSEHVTSAIILDRIGRLTSSLFDTTSNDATRLDGLLRGALTPTGMQ